MISRHLTIYYFQYHQQKLICWWILKIFNCYLHHLTMSFHYTRTYPINIKYSSCRMTTWNCISNNNKSICITTSRRHSACGLVKFPVLILSYNLFNAISKAPIPLKKLLNLKSSNRYGIALYNSTNM